MYFLNFDENKELDLLSSLP